MIPKNAIKLMHKRDDRNGEHLGSCNIQCLNVMVYKSLANKIIKIIVKFVEFAPDLRTMVERMRRKSMI